MKKIQCGRTWAIAFSLVGMAAMQALAGTYHVSVTGNDTNAGTEAAPFATIQKAATLVNPGDTVIVNAGVYYGPVILTRAGTAAAPIIFKTDSVAKDRVVITNANKPIRSKEVTWTLEDQALNMYSAPMDHQPSRVLSDGVDLLPYKHLAGLKVFKMGEDQTYPGNEHGFSYDGNKIYIRLNPLYGAVDPNQKTIAVAPSAGVGEKGLDFRPDDTSRNTFHINTETAAHVVLDGFSFETPGISCVYIRGSDVTVKNCWFRGCKSGVAGGKRDDNDTFSSANIIVEYCDYSQFPAFDDAKWMIQNRANDHPNDKFYWWQRKRNEARSVERALDYETSGITQRMGSNWIIRNCNISQCMDGMSYMSMEGETGPIDIYNNVFSDIIDNAIEFENHAINVRFHHNEIRNVFMPISLQPLGGTPWPTNLWVYKNLIYNDPALGLMWKEVGNYRSAGLKIGAAEKQWKWYAWMKDVPTTLVELGQQGMWIYNNTIYTPSGNYMEHINSNSQKMAGVNLYNNITICGEYYISEKGTAQVIKDNYESMAFSNNIRSTDTAVTYKPDEVVAGSGGATFNDPALVGLENLAGGNFSLTAKSPARGRGVKPPNDSATDWSEDCGAIPFGTTWVTPVVGPQKESVPAKTPVPGKGP